VNRSRRPLELLDLVCYSANPQVHAFDCATLVENLEGLRSTIENARLFSADLALAITPVTLKPRFRAGTARPQPGELPMQVDPRQASLFGAGWTAGALGALARPGVASVTFFETTGWRGVMETEGGSPDGSGFGSIPGAVFPLYHVLADAAEYRGGWIAEMEPGDPLLLGGIALRQDSRLTILAASFSPERQNARLEGVPPRLRIRRLNEENAVRAMTDPEAYRAAPRQHLESADGVLEIEFLPFEIIRLDAE